MGLAKKINIKSDEEFCAKILESDKKIRFVGLINGKSELLASVNRKDVDSLLTPKEIGMSIHYTLERWRKAQNFGFRFGKEKFSLTEYENVTLITIPVGSMLLLISTDSQIKYDKIVDSVTSLALEIRLDNLIAKTQLLEQRV